MTARAYQVHVEGVEAFDLSLGALRVLCDVLTEGALRAARLAAEGRSGARGAVPGWALRAADLRLKRFAPGSLNVDVHAQRLVDVAPQLFAQQTLFPDGLDPERTALDLFLDAANDATAGVRDSDRFDVGLLDVLASTQSLFDAGVTCLTVSGAGRSTPTRIDATGAKRMREMADQTPVSRIARVRGVLDSLTVSTSLLTLKVEDGRILRGHAGAVGVDGLKPQLGHTVVVEGLTTFRPSGDALRIIVESVRPAAGGDVIWAKLPHVEPVSSKARPSFPTGGAGLDAFFGAWPGDETDEELAAALRDLA